MTEVPQTPAPHGGALAVAAARRHGVTTMFTLSGGHVFPLYDGAVKADPPLRLLDVRHEQTAVFAAEATARLTRTPGLAVLTAGPGVTNGVSAITTAHFNGPPVVVLAGRAPDYRWGSGSLQEIDHPQLVAAVTKRAWTEHETKNIAAAVDEAFVLAGTAHRGPVFLDMSLEALFGQGEAQPAPGEGAAARADGAAAARHRERPGPGHPPGRPRAAGDAGQVHRPARGRPRHRGGRAAGLPARLRRVRRPGRRHARAGRARGRRAGADRDALHAGRLRGRGPDRVLRRARGRTGRRHPAARGPGERAPS